MARGAGWPRGLSGRIHRANRPIAAWPEEHIGRRLLIAHAECKIACVGWEVPFPGRESFDQVWQSELLGKSISFSSYAYCFLSFDLILKEWLTHPPEVSDAECRTLHELPGLEELLAECRQAALAERSALVLRSIPYAESFLSLWRESIVARLAEDRLPLPGCRPLPRPWQPFRC